MKTRQHTKRQNTNRQNAGPVRGFTLVELLVVISVLLVVMTMTLLMVNQTTKGDKIASASRQVQSMLEGARARALHAREPRGVRFISAPNEPDLVTSMVYIGSPGKYTVGQIRINDAMNGGNGRRITLLGGANWNNLASRGLLDNTGGVARIRINGKPTFYTIAFISGQWTLTKDFVETVDLNSNLPYELDLLPAVLANQEPRELPEGVVIDIDHSERPASWSNVNRRDILFSPRGTVIGTEAASSHIHLLITGLGDVAASGAYHKEPGDPTKEDAETIVTVTTQTGSVSTHSVFSNDPYNAATNDPFRYAESGVERK